MLSQVLAPAGQPSTVLTPLVNPGGQPPDVVPVIQSVSTLEPRPPLHRCKSSLTGNAGDVDTDQGKKESYASMAAKSSGAGVRGKPAATLTDEEVIILEEDVIVDKSGAIPSIQFSDRVHDQVNCNMRNAIIVHLLGRTIGKEAASGGVDQELNQNPEPDVTISESNLFGPWMVVEHRRRKPVITKRDVGPAVHDFSINRGSRFAALEVPDDIGLLGSKDEIVQGVTRTVEADVRSGEGRTAPPQMVVHKNTAYVASNPEKKSRNNRKMTSPPAVLPIVEGQVAIVVSRKAQVQGGNHTAVLIQEQNERDLPQSMSRGGQQVGGLLKWHLGVHGYGLKAKRALEIRRGACTSVSGFIDRGGWRVG
ncbi:hypothetical protein V6N12_066205 [Hibiscus sabdariffa]|uniref:Uncharacterized protein n=1 Tax=Hibiscus sabdariffa TaxID=183260 RepID=A0ABR2B934_9ROSI